MVESDADYHLMPNNPEPPQVPSAVSSFTESMDSELIRALASKTEGEFEISKSGSCNFTIQQEGVDYEFEGVANSVYEKRLYGSFVGGDGKVTQTLLLIMKQDHPTCCQTCNGPMIHVQYVQDKLTKELCTFALKICCCKSTTYIRPMGFQITMGCCMKPQRLRTTRIIREEYSGTIRFRPNPHFKFPAKCSLKDKLAIWACLVFYSVVPGDPRRSKLRKSNKSLELRRVSKKGKEVKDSNEEGEVDVNEDDGQEDSDYDSEETDEEDQRSTSIHKVPGLAQLWGAQYL